MSGTVYMYNDHIPYLEITVDMLNHDTQYILHAGHQDKKSCSSTTYNDVDYVPLKIY